MSKSLTPLKRKIHAAMMLVDKLQAEYRKETGRNYVISGPMPRPEFPATCRICIRSESNGIIDVCGKHRESSIDAAKVVYSDIPLNRIFTISIDPDVWECNICREENDAEGN